MVVAPWENPAGQKPRSHEYKKQLDFVFQESSSYTGKLKYWVVLVALNAEQPQALPAVWRGILHRHPSDQFPTTTITF